MRRLCSSDMMNSRLVGCILPLDESAIGETEALASKVNTVRADGYSDAGTSMLPRPSARCIVTTSSQRPNFRPAARSVPAI